MAAGAFLIRLTSALMGQKARPAPQCGLCAAAAGFAVVGRVTQVRHSVFWVFCSFVSCRCGRPHAVAAMVVTLAVAADHHHLPHLARVQVST